PDSPSITVAKRAHRTVHRVRATGVPRSRDRLQRCGLTTHLETVRGVLRTIAHAFGARERRPGFAGRLAVDRWEDHRHSAGWRPPSSIRAPRGLNGSRVTDSSFPNSASTATRFCYEIAPQVSASNEDCNTLRARPNCEFVSGSTFW